MPGHTFLYSPPVTMIRDLIDSGELGEIYFISTSRVNLGIHQPDVSVVWDLGPHDFSILRYWLGELPAKVAAMTRGCVMPDTPDVAFIHSRSGRARSRTSSSPGSPRASCGGRRSSAQRRWSSTTTRAASPSGSSTPARDLPDPQTFGEYQLTYRTGDILSPKVAATEPLALRAGRLLQRRSDRCEPGRRASSVSTWSRITESVDRSLVVSAGRASSGLGCQSGRYRARAERESATRSISDGSSSGNIGSERAPRPCLGPGKVAPRVPEIGEGGLKVKWHRVVEPGRDALGGKGRAQLVASLRADDVEVPDVLGPRRRAWGSHAWSSQAPRRRRRRVGGEGRSSGRGAGA